MGNNIKYLLVDVDGTLTDGKIYVGQNGELFKSFNVKDGYAIKELLPKAGIQVVIITGRKSEIVSLRANEMGVKYVFQGVSNKENILQSLKKQLGVSQDEIAYFGDDINDLTSMLSSGLIGCPADACSVVKERADYVCVNKAGDGALREFAEWMLSSDDNGDIVQKRIEKAIDYIQKLDVIGIKPGKYIVDDKFYYTVQEYYTKPVDDCILESHRNYVDIQYMVSGEEIIYIVDISHLSVLGRYNEKNDVQLWFSPRKMTRLLLHEGSYIVLYPENAHMGCIISGSSMNVKKIVGKVLLF